MSRPELLSLPKMTVDQFMDWDGGGHVGKLELIDGVVRAMAPASATHSIIQGNLVAAIHTHLRATGSRCRVAPEAAMQPAIRKLGNVRVPDLAVTCASPSQAKLFVDPVLIIEVLSPSNEDDTWESSRALAPLLTLTEIVMVASEKIEVEIFRREPAGAWTTEPGVVHSGRIELTSIGLDLDIAEVYRGTYLDAAES